MLAGIVNRMDRAYLAEANCGEIRLIYRLVRTNAPEKNTETADAAASPRLPMTLNVVLKGPREAGATGDRRQGQAVTCAEIARRWLAAGDCIADRC